MSDGWCGLVGCLSRCLSGIIGVSGYAGWICLDRQASVKHRVSGFHDPPLRPK